MLTWHDSKNILNLILSEIRDLGSRDKIFVVTLHTTVNNITTTERLKHNL